MAWRIEFEKAAAAEFERLERKIQERIWGKLRHFASVDDPRALAKPLRANLSGLWSLRVGSWRIVMRIEPDRQRILVLRTGHRKSVYE